MDYCPVCGWGTFVEGNRSVEELRASHDICDWCSCEYGYRSFMLDVWLQSKRM